MRSPRRPRPRRRQSRAQVRGGSQVPGAALALRQRLVRDVPHEVLEESVLAVLGRTRVGLDAEHLLAYEDASSGSISTSEPASAETPRVNVLPRTAPSWRSRRSSAVRPSSRAAMRACSVSGTSSASTGPVNRIRSLRVRVTPDRGACARSRPRTAGCPRRARGCGRGPPWVARARARREDPPLPAGTAARGRAM